MANDMPRSLFTRISKWTLAVPTMFVEGLERQFLTVNSDYWRDKPFYTGTCRAFQPRSLTNAFLPGLSKGCTSTEADVWLYNDTLYVRGIYADNKVSPTHWTNVDRSAMINLP